MAGEPHRLVYLRNQGAEGERVQFAYQGRGMSGEGEWCGQQLTHLSAQIGPQRPPRAQVLLLDALHYTLVPNATYTAGDKEKIAELSFLPNGNGIKESNIEAIDATLLWQPEEVVPWNSRAIPGPVHRLAMARKWIEDWDAPTLWLDAWYDALHLTIIKNGMLQLHNSYSLRDDADVLYYTAAAAEQTGVSLARDRVLWSGPRTGNESLYPLLKKYIRSLNPFPVDGPPLEGPMHELDRGEWAALIALPLCAS